MIFPIENIVSKGTYMKTISTATLALSLLAGAAQAVVIDPMGCTPASPCQVDVSGNTNGFEIWTYNTLASTEVSISITSPLTSNTILAVGELGQAPQSFNVPHGAASAVSFQLEANKSFYARVSGVQPTTYIAIGTQDWSALDFLSATSGFILPTGDVLDIENPPSGGGTGSANPVPIPAGGWLLLAGLGALTLTKRRAV